MKIYILIISLFFSINVNSQNRVNPPKNLKIGEFKSWIKGSDVLGWDFHNNEWKSRKGYLRVGNDDVFIDIYEKNNEITKSKSFTEQNFKEIGILKIDFKEKQYIGIGVEKLRGRYRYPTIKEDWIINTNYYIFVFEVEELIKLAKIDGYLELEPILGTYDDPLKSDQKFQSCYENVNFLFENKSSDKWKMVFKKFNDEGKIVIRFLLPQKTNKYLNNEFIDFEKHYFEITDIKFNDLLKMISELGIVLPKEQ